MVKSFYLAFLLSLIFFSFLSCIKSTDSGNEERASHIIIFNKDSSVTFLNPFLSTADKQDFLLAFSKNVFIKHHIKAEKIKSVYYFSDSFTGFSAVLNKADSALLAKDKLIQRISKNVSSMPL